MSEIPKVVVPSSAAATAPAPAPASAPPFPVPNSHSHAPAARCDGGFVTASHAILFHDSEANRCDVCAEALDDPAEQEDSEDSGFDVRGRGLLVWSRGEERRYQEPPLCAACATAIGVSALQRWEIEEEEG